MARPAGIATSCLMKPRERTHTEAWATAYGWPHALY